MPVDVWYSYGIVLSVLWLNGQECRSLADWSRSDPWKGKGLSAVDGGYSVMM